MVAYLLSFLGQGVLLRSSLAQNPPYIYYLMPGVSYMLQYERRGQRGIVA